MYCHAISLCTVLSSARLQVFTSNHTRNGKSAVTCTVTLFSLCTVLSSARLQVFTSNHTRNGKSAVTCTVTLFLLCTVLSSARHQVFTSNHTERHKRRMYSYIQLSTVIYSYIHLCTGKPLGTPSDRQRTHKKHFAESDRFSLQSLVVGNGLSTFIQAS